MKNCHRQVKQQLTDLELLGRDIAKGIVEAGKVGVDCLDQDEMFLIVPTIGKQIKFHRNRQVLHVLTSTCKPLPVL